MDIRKYITKPVPQKGTGMTVRKVSKALLHHGTGMAVQQIPSGDSGETIDEETDSDLSSSSSNEGVTYRFPDNTGSGHDDGSERDGDDDDDDDVNDLVLVEAPARRAAGGKRFRSTPSGQRSLRGGGSNRSYKRHILLSAAGKQASPVAEATAAPSDLSVAVHEVAKGSVQKGSRQTYAPHQNGFMAFLEKQGRTLKTALPNDVIEFLLLWSCDRDAAGLFVVNEQTKAAFSTGRSALRKLFVDQRVPANYDVEFLKTVARSIQLQCAKYAIHQAPPLGCYDLRLMLIALMNVSVDVAPCRPSFRLPNLHMSSFLYFAGNTRMHCGGISVYIATENVSCCWFELWSSN
jgi:hypothetical protein